LKDEIFTAEHAETAETYLNKKSAFYRKEEKDFPGELCRLDPKI
jgi:hypothetical protein